MIDFRKPVKTGEEVRFCRTCNTLQYADVWDIGEEKPLVVCKICDMEAFQIDLYKQEIKSKT